MAKFNTLAGARPVAQQPTAVNHEGAAAYSRDTKLELFMLGVANMVSEDTFYERAGERDERFEQLVHQVAVADVDWLTRFVGWLRNGANMRSAPLVAAAEGVHARLQAGLTGGNRELARAAMARADEPGELLAYWRSRHGRAVPFPLRKALADAARWLYTERSLLKYDTDSHAYRFADVLAVARPVPADGRQDALFRVAFKRRHRTESFDEAVAGGLQVIVSNGLLRADAHRDPTVLLDAGRLTLAGMTREDVLALDAGRNDRKALWEALIPSMGYMARLRNLKAFDEAGVSDEVAEHVAAQLADPAEVARSRQLPFRFLTAFLETQAAGSLRWGHALDKAMQASLVNVPELPGRTLVLIDTSLSMTGATISKHSKVTPLQAGAVLGVALASRCERVDLVGWASGSFTHEISKGGALLAEVARFVARADEVGSGTDMAGAVRRRYNGHDRVFIVSDMQTQSPGVTSLVPAHVPLYGFNLGGYGTTQVPAFGTRMELGGMNDATFRLIELAEAGAREQWPF